MVSESVQDAFKMVLNVSARFKMVRCDFCSLLMFIEWLLNGLGVIVEFFLMVFDVLNGF